MASKTIFTQVKSTQSLDEVTDEVANSLRRLGGQVVVGRGGMIEVTDGNSGVPFAFVAQFQAFISVKQNKKKDNTFDVDCQIRWSPNSVFWILLVIGFCLIITWIGNILYLFIDPVPSYQQTLNRVQAELE